ncbi:MAG: DUF2520 domain-containing protein [Bacteroidetes bacterium]|jgi:predicted short-subunit dehydrogenase-like oxidoreductase (DUF2520 family)|nr:DUF2520 domain-containing protein [Bacteroidota bacterium]
MKDKKPTVTIIGTGSLGTALLHFFKTSTYTILSSFNSKGGILFRGKDKINLSNICPAEASEIGDLIFITTPDNIIPEISEKLSAIEARWNQKCVVHCSGALFSDELKSVAEKGGDVAAMHPIQSFNRGDGKERFEGIFVTLEGDPNAIQYLKPIVKSMAAKPVAASKSQKLDLHIAAVMVSNYAVALMHSAESLLNESGLEDGMDMLKPLILQTIENVFVKGTSQALSGPVARGDTETVSAHLSNLKTTQRENIYRVLGLEAARIAEKSGNLSSNQAKSLRELLSLKINE